MACQNPYGYSIDWDQRASLHNWTTELDLICADPATIGVMGTITFVSIGLGSILMGGLMDQYGRKTVLLGTMMVSPLVQILWLVHPSLLTIYFGLFWIGLVYSVRASAAYVYTTESLLSAAKLQFCVYQFMTDGMIVACFAFLYWSGMMTWRKQIMLNLCATCALIFFTKFSLPESPAFLYSKGDIAELKTSLVHIAKSNGNSSPSQLEQTMAKLQANKLKE